MLKIGIQYTQELLVTHDKTAKAVRSGGLDVLATPILIALMETCAWQSVLSYMESGFDTVGISVDMQHMAPTPVGMMIHCTSTLIAIHDRELTFQIEAFDDDGKIAQACHKRFIINIEKFQNKADSKKEK